MSPKGGGYPIDEMRKAVQLFASLGEGPAQIQRAIADTAEVAAAKDIDFAEAANIVRMALTGHIEMLTRYGYISREAAKHIHTVEQAMRAIETGTSGAAEQRANKLAGDFGRLDRPRPCSRASSAPGSCRSSMLWPMRSRDPAEASGNTRTGH